MPLILSPGLIVSPADGSDLHYPLIGWHNQVTFNNVSADSEAAGYPATNLGNPATTNRWLSAITEEQLVEVSNIEGQANYVAVARHTLNGATISVEAITAEPGADWEVVHPGLLVANGEPIVLRFVAGFYVGVRLRIVPDGVAPSIAVLFVGDLIAVRPGIRPSFTPPSDARDVDLVQGMSISGEHLGAIVEGASLSTSVEFEAMEPDFYDVEMRDFVRGASAGDPFFFVWDPATHPDDAAYCWLTQSAKPVIIRSTGDIGLSFSIGGLAL